MAEPPWYVPARKGRVSVVEDEFRAVEQGPEEVGEGVDVGGTAGGATGLVKTPASNSRRHIRKVFSIGPMSTGTMGVSVGPMSKPSSRKPSCSRRVLAHSRSRRSGSRWRTCRAASTPAVFAGGSEAVKMSLP